jgi:KDEL-tailed cysteine endopeptidase
MRSALLVLALAFAVVLATSDVEMRRKFTEFQQKFGKSYSTQSEFESRFRIFRDNMNKAAQLSAVNERATFGMNKFSDLSSEEFAAHYLMPTTNFETYVAPQAKDFSVAHDNAAGCSPDATNYNWFTQCGACTPIYNQGQCGSCWAFSATETIESYLFLGGGSLTPLSISQIVDCDTAGEDEGCNGGFPT